VTGAADGVEPVSRWHLVWARVTICGDVAIRLAILAGLIYLAMSTWPAEGMLVLIAIPTISYAAWQTLVLVFEFRLLWQAWESPDEARRSVTIVAVLGLPRLLWAIPIVLREDGGTTAYVVVAVATVAVAVSAAVLWLHTQSILHLNA
jgi:hypothetical protein